MYILEINNLSKYFGGVKAVDDFNMKLEEGSITSIIGPNGAGKTTIFNLITGIYPPTKGEILLHGKNIVGLPTNQIANLGLARTFQNIRLFANVSVLDNVRAACHDMANYSILEGFIPTRKRFQQEALIKERSMALLETVGLDKRANEIASKLPYGYQRRLEIARALALTPKILLLDEPAAGMNPEESQQLMEFIRKMREKFSLTTLLIEHHMELVMGLSDYITVVDFGKTIATGTPKEVQNNPEVIKAYLGYGEKNEEAA
jgi:branched-chain amino acid transport system ATP-binding protein